MAGCLPKVSNLYPPVQYPVSRGTASLSSLVTWNHEDTLENLIEMDTSIMSVGLNHYSVLFPIAIMSAILEKKKKKKDDGRLPYPTLLCGRADSTTALSTCATQI
ncbi:unnamed protein product, partial [Timema podura]|nr:unnamed protein product [Timema podura]